MQASCFPMQASRFLNKTPQLARQDWPGPARAASAHVFPRPSPPTTTTSNNNTHTAHTPRSAAPAFSFHSFLARNPAWSLRNRRHAQTMHDDADGGAMCLIPSPRRAPGVVVIPSWLVDDDGGSSLTPSPLPNAAAPLPVFACGDGAIAGAGGGSSSPFPSISTRRCPACAPSPFPTLERGQAAVDVSALFHAPAAPL